MKRNSHRLLLFFILSTSLQLSLLSQQIKVSASKSDYNLGTTSVHKIIGHDSTHFYVLKFYGNQYHIEKLDKDLNLVRKEPIKLFEGFKTYEFENIVHFYNELYIFVSKLRITEIVLYYQKIDKNTLLPATDLIELSRSKFIKGNWPDFHFALSRHEKKLLVACRTKLSWSKAQFNEYYVFGEGLELIWKRHDSFEFTGLGPRDNNYIVDEMGNISILSLRKRESILSLFSDERNMYSIYRYVNNGAYFKEYPVTLGEKYIRGIKIIGGNKGELICAGLYSELFHKGMRGTFFFKIDPEDGRVYDNNLNEFDNALLTRLTAMNEPTLNKEELMDYVVTDLVLRSNGKILLIAEQFFNQSYDTYNNIIVTCLDTEGSVYWSQVVEKNQDFSFGTRDYRNVEPFAYRDYIINTGTMDSIENYCSYALMAPLGESGIVLFFNDDIRNINQQGKRKNFNRPKKSYLLAVRIDEYGNISKQPVVKREKRGTFPEPIRFYDTLYNSIVIPSFRNRRFVYYNITAEF